jgi:hypothetical protein
LTTLFCSRRAKRAKVFALKHFEVRFVRFGERDIDGLSSLGVPDMGL